MTLKIENNSNKGDTLEQTKANLKEQIDAYKKSARENFNSSRPSDASLNIQNNQIDTQCKLLHIAALKGQSNTVKHLVDEKKVNVDQQNNDGNIALHWAAQGGHLDIVKHLVDEKLDIVKYLVDEKKVNVDQKNNYGHTPRNLAKDENVIQLLKTAENKQIFGKAVKAGSIYGIIAALTVGIGCVVASAGLSMLVIAGIAVAGALAVGLVAGGITYAVLETSNNKFLRKVENPASNLEDTNLKTQQPNGFAANL